jgi:hypothetical protein
VVAYYVKNKKMLKNIIFHNKIHILLIFFKKIQDFIIAQPLNEMVSFLICVVVLILYNNKNIVAKQKNQNGGFIQDGDEIYFLFYT